jgi:hypothetical protein
MPTPTKARRTRANNLRIIASKESRRTVVRHEDYTLDGRRKPSQCGAHVCVSHATPGLSDRPALETIGVEHPE